MSSLPCSSLPHSLQTIYCYKRIKYNDEPKSRLCCRDFFRSKFSVSAQYFLSIFTVFKKKNFFVVDYKRMKVFLSSWMSKDLEERIWFLRLEFQRNYRATISGSSEAELSFSPWIKFKYWTRRPDLSSSLCSYYRMCKDSLSQVTGPQVNRIHYKFRFCALYYLCYAAWYPLHHAQDCVIDLEYMLPRKDERPMRPEGLASWSGSASFPA